MAPEPTLAKEQETCACDRAPDPAPRRRISSSKLRSICAKFTINLPNRACQGAERMPYVQHFQAQPEGSPQARSRSTDRHHAKPPASRSRKAHTTGSVHLYPRSLARRFSSGENSSPSSRQPSGPSRLRGCAHSSRIRGPPRRKMSLPKDADCGPRHAYGERSGCFISSTAAESVRTRSQAATQRRPSSPFVTKSLQKNKP